MIGFYNKMKTKGSLLLAFLLAMTLLVGVAGRMPAAYAEPAAAEEAAPAEGEVPVEEAEPSPSQQALGITVEAADEDEEEGTIMDSMMGWDRIIWNIFIKAISYLSTTLGILIGAVVLITIYIMITRTTRLSKQNLKLSRRPERAVAGVSGTAKDTRSVTRFGDTLNIRRNTQVAANQGAANVQRPVAPHRPSRPAQEQPGVRRPVDAGSISQPFRRPVQGQATPQPVRRSVATDQLPQPMRRSASQLHQPQRPAAPVQRHVSSENVQTDYQNGDLQ